MPSTQSLQRVLPVQISTINLVTYCSNIREGELLQLGRVAITWPLRKKWANIKVRHGIVSTLNVKPKEEGSLYIIRFRNGGKRESRLFGEDLKTKIICAEIKSLR